MSNETVSFVTFGCKMNQYDTDFLKQAFKDQDFMLKEKGPSDLVVVNTCVVTGRSASKCRQAIRRAVRNGSKVIVTGCYPQLAADELLRIPGVIAVTGIRDREATPFVAKEALEKNNQITKVTPHGSDLEYQDTSVRCPSLTRAFLKIQEGCDDYCTYCIVPYTRGPSRSRPLASIVEEARQLVKNGYKEIVITGTHIGLYGKDIKENLGLAQVIRELVNIVGNTRLRISSLEPHDVTQDLLDCLKIPQVCHHLHLPVQSGSDRILKRMGRRYTVSQFHSIVKEARQVAPDLGLTADVIVGFPGESKEDFEKTLDLVNEVEFSRLHVFKFSARPGTRAWNYEDKVNEKEKNERSKTIISLGRELSFKFHSKYEGKVLEVLVEHDEEKDGLLQGFSGNYIRLQFPGEPQLKGTLVEVRGIRPTRWGMLCSLEKAGDK